MNLKEPTVSDLESLIKTCKKQGVQEFTLGELKFNFGGLNEDRPKRAVYGGPPNPEAEAEALLDNEAMLKEEQLSILRLSDPEAYEELLLTDYEQSKEELSDAG